MSTQEAGRIPQWTLGEKLRKAREDAGLQQQELADLIGISRRSVSSYENDDGSPPKRPVLLSWALATGVKLSWLQGEAPRTEPAPGGDDTEGSPDSGNIVCYPTDFVTDSEDLGHAA